jgi:hypothetical protein
MLRQFIKSYCHSHQVNKNPLNLVMLPEKVLDTGKYKKNEQRAKTPKLGKAELWFLALLFYSMRSIYL